MRRISAILLGLLILTLIVLPAAGCKQDSSSTSTSTEEKKSAATGDKHSGMSGRKIIVEVTKDGFSPQKITIKAGDGVVWKNTSGSDAQIHLDGGSPADIFADGQSYEAAFHEAGTFGYHNHTDSSMAGQITVE